MRGGVHWLGVVWLVVGCDSVRGPHQAVVMPAVRGRVVDSATLEAVAGARVYRSAGPVSDQRAEPPHGGERLQAPAPAGTDRDGRFEMGAVRGGYLLFEQPPPMLLGLRIEHPQYRSFVTNVDLLLVPPVQTTKGSEVDLGDLPLTLKEAP